MNKKKYEPSENAYRLVFVIILQKFKLLINIDNKLSEITKKL